MKRVMKQERGPPATSFPLSNLVRVVTYKGVPGLRAHFAGGAGDPPRLCREGKRKLTESSKEFPKGSARQRPEGSLREVRERRIARHPLLRASLFSSPRAPDTGRARGRSRRRRGDPWPPES